MRIAFCAGNVSFAREILRTLGLYAASAVSRLFKQIRLQFSTTFVGISKMETVFKCLVASRGYHVYGKTVWAAPTRGQKLYAKKETNAEALLVDKYAVAWMLKSKTKLVADVVGHVPQEISRFAYFFLKHGGSIEAIVQAEKYRCSPIAKGGLEIVLEAVFKIDDSKREILCRLKDFIQQNYDSAELEDSFHALDDNSKSLAEDDEEVNDDCQEPAIVIDGDDDSEDEA